MIHYPGVLAPNAKLRKFVVPEAPENEDADPCGHSIAYEQMTNGKTIRRRWIPWATMLLKVFAVGVLAFTDCQGRIGPYRRGPEVRVTRNPESSRPSLRASRPS